MTEISFKMGNGDEDLAPARAHDDDAAFDLKSNEEAVIHPGSRRLVKTSLFLELPSGFEAQIRPRSGLALKFGITVLNSPGTIDAGYRGEIGIILLNTGEEEFAVSRGDRIAQMVIQKLPVVTLKMADNLDKTNRGDGGFGSTGIG